MFEFAQTNIQLYRQMYELGYPLSDREEVAGAYRFLMPMFSGQYRGSEKPFISHLVGTASIIASRRLPVTLVVAGLLHAVYMAGDFGFQPGTRQTARKRRCIRNLAGTQVEEIVAVYDDMRWDVESLRTFRSRTGSLQGPEGAALTLQLANTLEDLLDYGVSYCSGSKFETLSSPDMQAELVALSELHAWPELTELLTRALADLDVGTGAVDKSGCRGESARVLPPSSVRKFLPAAQGWAVRRLRRLKAAID